MGLAMGSGVYIKDYNGGMSQQAVHPGAAAANTLGMDPGFWWSKIVGKCIEMCTFSVHFFVV